MSRVDAESAAVPFRVHDLQNPTPLADRATSISAGSEGGGVVVDTQDEGLRRHVLQSGTPKAIKAPVAALTGRRDTTGAAGGRHAAHSSPGSGNLLGAVGCSP